MEKFIIGLVGPSGVGKGYAKEALQTQFGFQEPIVATTRDRRPTDGIDRLSGLTIGIFQRMVEVGAIIFDHQPFGADNHWYGFLKDSLTVDGSVLTEIHVDNVMRFRQMYGNKLKLVGLTADDDYLAQNLAQRGTETTEDAAIRLTAALCEREKIRQYSEQGLIDIVIKVGNENREAFAQTMIQIVSSFFNK